MRSYSLMGRIAKARYGSGRSGNKKYTISKSNGKMYVKKVHKKRFKDRIRFFKSKRYRR